MIYLLEDDAGIRKLITYTLKTGGMEAEGFPTPSLFYEALGKALPELILLDIMLPEEDGLSVLARLKASADTADIPVIILTAKSSEFDKVIGLDRLKAIHVNDSLNDLGARKDRHAVIGGGFIGLDAFFRIVNHPALKGLPMVLETPNDLDGYAREIALLRQMEVE